MSPDGVTIYGGVDLLPSSSESEGQEANPKAGQFRLDQPLPLHPELPPAEEYPINDLGRVLAPAACAIADKVQVPASVAGQSVLAAAALAAQAFADVVLPHGQVVPISLFCMTVIGSGDRKSATDIQALRPVRMREKTLRDEYTQAYDRWKVEYAAWAAQKRKIENESKIGLDQRREKLGEIGPEPERPLHPTLTFDDITIDGLTKNLASAHGSFGVFTDEGATFTGGHSMSDENRLRTAANISKLWGGSPIVRTRAADGVTILTGRRMSMHLMIQPDASAGFLSNRALRDQGLLSRLLLAQPQSLAGFRPYRDADAEAESVIRSYSRRLLGLLETPPPLEGLAPNVLAPRHLPMSDEARALWIDSYNEVEGQLAPGHPLAGLKDVASKSGENAARIAAVLTIVENPHARQIEAEEMANAIALICWYLREAARLQACAQIDRRLVRAAELLSWLQAEPTDTVHFSRIMQYGPTQTRLKATADEALGILIDHDWVVEVSKRPRQFRVRQVAGR